MREIRIQVKRGDGALILRLAQEHDASWCALVDARTRDDAHELIFVNLPDRDVGLLVDAIEANCAGAEFVLVPHGILPFRTPVSHLGRDVRNVSHLSAFELVLSSLQSIGSWRALLLYALLSGVVAAYGIVFNVMFLLIAAMLIAPMGGPAMVCVIAAAIGDIRMFARGALRFWISIAILAVTAYLVGLGVHLRFSTELMELVTSFSNWAVALALAAAAAGAQAQAESDRASLVGGVATGFLVAASLSPPAAVLGLSMIIGRWDYVVEMSFLLVLTFVAVIAGGWLALLLYGVHPNANTAERGSARMRACLCGGACIAVIALVGWQLHAPATFRKADLSKTAVQATRTAFERLPQAQLVEAHARFARAMQKQSGRPVLLVEVIARTGAPSETEAVRTAVASELLRQLPDVFPVVDVHIIPRTTH